MRPNAVAGHPCPNPERRDHISRQYTPPLLPRCCGHLPPVTLPQSFPSSPNHFAEIIRGEAKFRSHAPCSSISNGSRSGFPNLDPSDTGAGYVSAGGGGGCPGMLAAPLIAPWPPLTSCQNHLTPVPSERTENISDIAKCPLESSITSS